jgi:hypothetical protein
VTTPDGDEFKDAIRRLHRVKNAAYRDSWKKRGEIMGIMANIARKVDRLEYVTDGAPASADESLLDTAVDLLIYSLKYQTYLADQDPAVAAALYQGGATVPPYSDGPDGFEVLLYRLNVMPVEGSARQGSAQASQGVLIAFAGLEACFRDTLASTSHRVAEAIALTHAVVMLIGSLTREAPERYRDFLKTCRREGG